MNSRVKMGYVTVLVVSCVALATPVWAQRGGRGGGGAESGGVASAVYDGKEFGISFIVPRGLVLYTPEAPGRYRAVLTDRRIAMLVNPRQVADTVTIKYADGMSEADLKSYFAVLETNPPQSRVPGYQKVKLALTKIGKDGSKEAIDFTYKTKQDGVDLTLRQIVFLHNGRGFTVSCSGNRRDFETANRVWFNPLLKQLEFR